MDVSKIAINGTSYDIKDVTARSTADRAESTADSAMSTADTAKSTADTAKSTADAAKSTADAAKSTANSATKKVEQLEQSMMSASYSTGTETISFTTEG